MRKFIISVVIITAFISLCATNQHKKGWVSLFDGKTLDGWKVGTNASSFSVVDGSIMVNGNVAHLFYDGPVQQHAFKNFEFKADVMTMPGSNSGIYFHTLYQESSWPKKAMRCR